MERPTNEYLLERFGKVAGYAAVPYVKANPWLRNDLMACADVAIFTAADAFDWEASEGCYGFASLLKLHVKAECRDLIASVGYASSGSRRALGADGKLHAHAAEDAADQEDGSMWDDASDADAVAEVFEVAERVLTGRQYEAFARYYADGICSDTYVAEMLGVNQPAATKLRKRAEERIREALLDEME